MSLVLDMYQAYFLVNLVISVISVYIDILNIMSVPKGETKRVL